MVGCTLGRHGYPVRFPSGKVPRRGGPDLRILTRVGGSGMGKIVQGLCRTAPRAVRPILKVNLGIIRTISTIGIGPSGYLNAIPFQRPEDIKSRYDQIGLDICA